MSLASNPSVSDGVAAHTFDEIVRDASGTVRSDADRPRSAPRLLTIKHTMAGPNSKGAKVDRHLVSVSDTTVTDGVPATATVNLSIVVPQTFTGDIGKDFSIASGFLYENLASILRGES